MDKLDLSKRYKSYYTAKSQPELVTVDAARYLSLTGKGDPSHSDYGATLQALYATAYGIKFLYKKRQQDFVVAKLEGQWWFDDEKYIGTTMTDAPLKIPRSEWNYRMLIRLPDFVMEDDVKTIAENVVTQKQIAMAAKVQLYTLAEGLCVQMLHLGAFEKEPETLHLMMEFMKGHQLQRNGLHHEIYLSDFNKTSPEKLKTILREPVKYRETIT